MKFLSIGCGILRSLDNVVLCYKWGLNLKQPGLTQWFDCSYFLTAYVEEIIEWLCMFSLIFF